MIKKDFSLRLYAQTIKLIALYCSVFMTTLMMILFIVIYFYAYCPITNITTAQTVFIKPGDSIEQVGVLLKKSGIIKSVHIFTLFASLTHNQGSIKSGEYVFLPGISLHCVLNKLEKHDVVFHFFTVPEGISSCFVFKKLNKNKLLSTPLLSVPPEGSLFPGTYQYIWGMSKMQLVRIMMRAADQFKKNHIQEIPRILSSWQEVVTLASMIEAETSLDNERPKIASVFFNRLKKHMSLQSDPTVIYSITHNCYHLNRDLSWKDIHIKSPYNTYMIHGLPPHPINNPGKSSIFAVLHPDLTPYLYFVATGSGGHIFAKDLKEHHKNVDQYYKRKKRS